jgi:cation transport ATPase
MSLPAESTGAIDASADVSAVAITSTIVIDSTPPPSSAASSSRRKTVVGGVLAGVGALGFAAVTADFEPARTGQLTGVLALISAVVISLEIAELLKASQYRYSPLNFVPSTGALLICAAGILSAFLPDADSGKFAGALLGGPALTVGAVLVVRALITRIWDEAERLTSLVSGFPRDGKVVAEGEVFPISAGVFVPTDGRVRSGTCAVLERYLSPDAHFRVKDEADIVFAGSYVLSGEASVQALTSSYDSCLKRLEQAVLPGLRWVEESLRRDHDHIVTPLVYVLLFCFVSSAIFWDERGASGSTILLAGGTILTISLLVQLGEALYATRSRLVRAWAQRGFLINSAKAWAELYHVHNVVYDPSRMAATTACHVKELNLMDDRISEHSLCSCIASLVGRAEDPALAMIGDYCQRVVGAVQTDRVMDLHEYEGRGISGTVKGIEFSIGSEDFLVDRGILIQPTESLVEEGSDDKMVLVAIGDDLIARFWVAFGQNDLLSEESLHRWPKNLHGRLIDPSERELAADVLLVRGDESDAVGRTHSPEVTFLKSNTLEVPSSSVVALTEHVELIPMLVKECRRHVHEVLRARAWILFATFVSVCLVFAGLVTPLIPVALLPLIALCIFI